MPNLLATQVADMELLNAAIALERQAQYAYTAAAKTFLETKPTLTVPLKLPEAYARTGLYYPTECVVKYDGANKEYSVSLQGMVLN